VNFGIELFPRTISKRQEAPANCIPCQGTSTIYWCQEGSDFWMTIPSTTCSLGTESQFGTLFTNAFNRLNGQISIGHGANHIPNQGSTYYLVDTSTTGGFFATSTTNSLQTYNNVKTCVDILQNWLYVTRRYQCLVVGCWMGGSHVVDLQMW